MDSSRDGVAGRAVRGFTSVYDRPPAAAWSAPGRANLIGEHTDYNEGFVLPFAITERTCAAAAPRDDDVIAVTSSAFPETVRVRFGDIAPGAVAGWAGYPLGVAWALAQARGRRLRRGPTCISIPTSRPAAGSPRPPRWRWRPPERSPACGA